MPKNAEFLKALSDKQAFADVAPANKAARDKALDDLINADVSQAKGFRFRNAIYTNQAFWESFSATSALMVLPKGSDPRKYFLGDAFLLMAGFDELKKAAIKQRILVGLNSITDVDVLVGIMGNNEAECRSYISSKKISECGSSAPTLQNLLTTADIEAIRKAASDRLLLQLIDSCKDEAALTALKNAMQAPDASQLITTIPAASFPSGATSLIWPVDSQVIDACNKKLHAVINEGIIKTIYTDINDLATQNNTQKSLKELAEITDDNEFIQHFKVCFPKITDVTKLDSNGAETLNKRVLALNFAMHLSTYSSLTAEAYPELMAKFGDFSKDQQQRILSKSKAIPALLLATDEKDIASFLELDPNEVNNLFDELQRVNQFKAIENTEIAKILATIGYPSPNLEFKSPQSAKTINQLLQKNRYVESTQNHPFDTLATYEHVVESIFKELKAPVIAMDEFKTIFGIDVVNQTLDNTSERFTSIKQQHMQNSLLMDKVEKIGLHNYDEALLALLLVQKKVITTKNKIPSQEVDFTETNLNEAQNIIDNWGSYDDFIINLSKYMPRIKHELSPSQYKTMQEKRLQDLLSSNATATKKGIFSPDKKFSDLALDATQKALERTENNRKLIAQSMNPLMFIKNVETIHLICPAFRAQGTNPVKPESPADVIKRYDDMIKQCDFAIKSLDIDFADLEFREKVLNAVNAGQPPSEKLQAQIKAIAEEKRLITALKEEYTDRIKAKLTDIINAYQHVKPKTIATHLNKTHFKVFTGKIQHQPKTQSIPAAPPGTVGISANATSTTASSPSPDVLNDLLIDAPKAGEVRHTHMLFTDPKTNAETIIGIFKEEFKDVSVPLPVGGQLVSHPIKEVLLTIEEFPGADKPSERLEFAMVMISQLLANAEEAPGKNNKILLEGTSKKDFTSLQYLWTAAVIIGKENPKMKFGPANIEVPVFMKSWVAEQQTFSLKDYIKNTGNFSKSSLCMTAFCEADGTYKSVVKDEIKALNTVIGEKPTTQELQTIDIAAKRALNFSNSKKNFQEEIAALKERVNNTDENNSGFTPRTP